MSFSFKRFLILIVLVPALGAGLGCAPTPVEPASKNANPTTSDRVLAHGRIMPATGIIQIASMPGDRIEEVVKKVGALVEQGDPLVRLASEKLRRQELAIAKQKLDEARIQLKAKQAEAELHVQLSQRQWELAVSQELQAEKQKELHAETESHVLLARQQLDRLAKLRDDPRTKALVGTIEYEQRRIEYSEVESKYRQSGLASDQLVESSRAAIDLAKERYDAAKESRQLVDAMFPIRSLELQIELLEKQLEQSIVRSPLKGRILSVSCEPGEVVTQFPLMELADLSSIICMAEVQDTQIQRLKIGNRVEMESKALPSQKITGEVERVDGLVGIPALPMTNPMARTDFRSVPVRIKIDDPFVSEAASLIQLQLDVSISTSPLSDSAARSTDP